MPFDKLPNELYSAILSHIPHSSLQQTVLSLTRALPFTPISQRHLFESVKIARPHQAPSLYRRLHSARLEHVKNPGVVPDIALWIQHLVVEAWRVDADVLISIIRILHNLESLTICIGSDNFSPEHLEDVFKAHMTKLKLLSLRFSPYELSESVKKATYYQFLKGSYYDSTLRALSAWPSIGLSTLSIVHDPYISDPSEIIPSFAQPLVFFRLDVNLSLLIHSQNLKALTLRIPGRTIVRPLTMEQLNTKVLNPAPSISMEFLDISTCQVSENDLENLLARFRGLKHLMLDECTGLIRGSFHKPSAQELGWWLSLGKRCALTGVKKAKDKEKELWTQFDATSRAHSTTTSQDHHIAANTPSEPRRPRPGRRGLATATFSLRGSTPLHIGNDHLTAATAASNPHQPPKIYVVPPLPTLLTLTLFPASNPSESITHDTRQSIIAEFEKGWSEGVRTIWEKRSRLGILFQRCSNRSLPRARFLKFRPYNDGYGRALEEEAMEDITTYEEGIFSRHRDPALDLGSAPLLCFGGQSAEESRHASGCTHSIARRTYRISGLNTAFSSPLW